MAAPRKDNVEKQILDATEALLQSDPIESISLAQIAQKADISKGTLYYHYKTKDEILFDIAKRYLTQQYQELYDWTGDPEKDTSLHRLFKYILERDFYEPTVRFQLLYSASEGNEELRAQLLELYRKFEKAIAEKIAERIQGISADYLAWLALLISDGMIIQAELKNEDFHPDEFIKKTDALITKLSEIYPET